MSEITPEKRMQLLEQHESGSENFLQPPGYFSISSPEELRLNQVYLQWDNINFYVPAKQHDIKTFEQQMKSRDGPAINNIITSPQTGKMVKQILKESSGYVKPGEAVAIMGPSGSGKTSLLNVLAGRMALTEGSSFNGDIQVNGRDLKKNNFGKIAAFV